MITNRRGGSTLHSGSTHSPFRFRRGGSTLHLVTLSIMASEKISPQLDGSTPIDVLCMACTDATCDFKPMKFQRRPLGDKDVLIEMKYCGICHTDVHAAAGHLSSIGVMSGWPIVPGHELSGVAIAVGRKSRWATTSAWAAWSTPASLAATAETTRSRNA